MCQDKRWPTKGSRRLTSSSSSPPGRRDPLALRCLSGGRLRGGLFLFTRPRCVAGLVGVAAAAAAVAAAAAAAAAALGVGVGVGGGGGGAGFFPGGVAFQPLSALGLMVQDLQGGEERDVLDEELQEE